MEKKNIRRFLLSGRNLDPIFSRSTHLPEETMEDKFFLKKVEGNDLIKNRIRKVRRCKKRKGKEKHKSSYSIVKR